MKDLVSHVEFLILQHEYVIIPTFGGFVLNREVAFLNDTGEIAPPNLNVGFNAELKFNDGLLAHSFMKSEGISYEQACDRLQGIVTKINFSLQTKKRIDFGMLGVLRIENENIVFDPNNGFRHPSVWGYSTLPLKSLSSDVESRKTKSIRLKHIFVAASSVAVLAFLVFSSSIDNSFFQKIQYSSFFIDYTTVKSLKLENRNPVSNNKYLFVNPIIEERKELNKVNQLEIEKLKSEVSRRKQYYIVVGGDINVYRANTLLSKLEKKGFDNVGIVESQDKFRVYIAKFDDKSEANQYLDTFRKLYPTYSDAWLYIQKK